MKSAVFVRESVHICVMFFKLLIIGKSSLTDSMVRGRMILFCIFFRTTRENVPNNASASESFSSLEGF